MIVAHYGAGGGLEKKINLTRVFALAESFIAALIPGGNIDFPAALARRYLRGWEVKLPRTHKRRSARDDAKFVGIVVGFAAAAARAKKYSSHARCGALISPRSRHRIADDLHVRAAVLSRRVWYFRSSLFLFFFSFITGLCTNKIQFRGKLFCSSLHLDGIQRMF